MASRQSWKNEKKVCLSKEALHCRLENDLSLIMDYTKSEWGGGMKLGTLVYEKSGKSKSNNAPFVGTIRLHLAGIL